MKNALEKLIKLQHLDDRLRELKLQKGDLPAVIENLDEDFQEKKSRSQELGDNVTKLHNDRKMFEKEVEASKAQLRKYEDQLYRVQNNKEYDAISLEIDTKKMEIEGLENKILQTIEDEETHKKSIDNLIEELDDIDNQLKHNKKELGEIDKLTREEEARLLHERDKLVKEIEPRYLKRYERIKEAKGGIAVVPIRRSSCGGCFSALPPQLIVEVRKVNYLNICEYCGRILYYNEEL